MKRAGVTGGRLMLELSDGSSIRCECIGQPFAGQIAAEINALTARVGELEKELADARHLPGVY